jgi:O-antigen ligase
LIKHRSGTLNPTVQIWPVRIILALVLLIPLAISIHTFDKFGMIKLVIFLFGCGLLLFYLLIYRQRFAGLPKTVVWAIILFLAVQAFQTFRLKNPLTGLWGEYGQSESLLVQTGFMILFLAGFSFIKHDPASRKKLVNVITIVTFFIGVFGIAEYFLGDPITQMNVMRIKSFFGDPNSLGAFLILALPLIISGFWAEKNKLWRWMTGFSFYTGIIALYLTFSRAAWFGFFFIGFFILIWGISRRLLKDRTYLKNFIITAGLITAGLMSGIILTCFQPQAHADYNLKARVTSITQGNDSGRHLLWTIALKTFQHSPWIGDGIGSFSKNFHMHQSVAAVRFWNLDRNISQAHNEILQYMATQGLLGTWAYLFLWFVLFWFSNFRNLLKRNLDLDHSSLWAAIFGYLVFTQFAYPLVHYSFLVWIYWGIMINDHNPPAELKQAFRVSPVLVTIAVIACIIWGWFLANIFRADIHYKLAFYQARRHLFTASLMNYRKAVNLAPFQYQYQYRYSLTLYRAAKYCQKQKQPDLAIRYFNEAKTTTLRLLEYNPGHYQPSFLLGQIAEAQADYHNARSFYRKALVLYPNNYQILFRLAKIQWLSGNQPAALEAYRAGVRINPDYMKSALDTEHLSVMDFTGKPE